MSTRFLTALLAAPRPIIMELKRRDGAGAELFGGRTLAEIAAGYEQAGAACLSVVTGHWFGGTLSMLSEVSALTRLPVLQKDFITSQAELDRAAWLGASAVLLTAGLLPVSRLSRLVDGALRRELTPFVEVTTRAEIESVPRAGECVIAVNNKDITTRERHAADLHRSSALLPAVTATGTRCPVSASGISGPAVAASLILEGFAGLLIGTQLLRTSDPRTWMAEFDRSRAAGLAASGLSGTCPARHAGQVKPELVQHPCGDVGQDVLDRAGPGVEGRDGRRDHGSHPAQR